MNIRNSAISFILVSTIITGCSQKKLDTHPAKFMKFEEEVTRIMEDAPCAWTHGKADPQSIVQYDFGCHGGEWGSVSLYLNKKKNAPDYVQNMRILWKEKEPGYAIGADEAVVAEDFMEFIARSYSTDFELLRTIFMGTKETNFSTTNLHFDYTYTQSKIYGLHRLEIIQTGSVSDN